jgi:Polyketide cyclase / dehydrase and lipid transport
MSIRSDASVSAMIRGNARMTRLTPVTLSELPGAPILVHVDTTIRVPRQRVFDALTGDPSRWGDFLPVLDNQGRWLTRAPEGTDSVREIGFGKLRIVETVLHHDDPARWSFRIESMTVPVWKAMIEDYILDDAPPGCTLHWTGAIWPIGPAPLARAVMTACLPRLVRRLSLGIERATSRRP